MDIQYLIFNILHIAYYTHFLTTAESVARSAYNWNALTTKHALFSNVCVDVAVHATGAASSRWWCARVKSTAGRCCSSWHCTALKCNYSTTRACNFHWIIEGAIHTNSIPVSLVSWRKRKQTFWRSCSGVSTGRPWEPRSPECWLVMSWSPLFICKMQGHGWYSNLNSLRLPKNSASKVPIHHNMIKVADLTIN